MNKKFSIIFIYFIFHFITCQLYAQQVGNNSVQIIESTNTHITIQVKIDSIQTREKIVNQNSYHLISISGFHLTTEPGKPQLPATGLLLAIPPTGSVNLEIMESPITTRSGLTLLPVPDQLLAETDQGEPQFVFDENFYKQDVWYPQELVRIGETGFIRDQRVASVQFFPVQYNPAQKMLRVYDSLTFKLNFENGAVQNPPGVSNPRFESMLQEILPNYETAKSWRKAKSSSADLQKAEPGLTAGSAYKIYVKEDGIYRVSQADLEAAGIVTSEIDPRTIKIMNRGKELPIYVRGEKDDSFDEGDYLEFYGQFNRGKNSYLSPHSISNLYWLTWGGNHGQRLAEADGGLYEKDSTRCVTPNAYQFTQHVEEDKVFDRLLLVTDESQDHWFWETMNAPCYLQFKFTLHHPLSNDSADVKVMMHGSTHTTHYPDHHSIIKINNYAIEDTTWDGQIEHLIEARVPNQILTEGENSLTIELPGDTKAGEYDQVFFNWLEIRYQRSFRAVNDFIELNMPPSLGLHQIEIDGFSSQDISLFDNLGRRIVNFDVTKKPDATFTATFQDVAHASAITYYVFTANAIKKPEKIEAEISSDLRSTQNGADYILITHAQFRSIVQPLADHRSAQDMRVRIIDVQDIYDEFSHGIFDPAAIHDFLQYAYENWTPPAPLYVLLVGDATWAFDKQVARNWGKTCYLPTTMKFTYSWGLTSSDNAFVCVSGEDRLPDMFIGRLPVNSIEEAQIIVNKILQYEQHPTINDWRKRVCLACGDGAFFEQSADYLYNEYIPEGFDVPRLYTNPRSKYFGSTEELVKIFNNGVALINFIGHGGGGVFFDAELFLLEDIVLLNNPTMLPVLFSLTCFIGYFDNPWTPSMGEELLRANGKGVVATFGAAGRAWLYGDYYLNNALFKSLFIDQHHQLGQVTTEAKWQMVAWSGSYWDHVENYNLLGDPALKIGFPEKEISLEIPNSSLKSGEQLTVKGAISDNPAGQVKLTLFDSNDSLIAKKILPVTDKQFETQIQLPSTMRSGQGIVKAYFWNEKEDAIGAAGFGIESPYFQQVLTDPAEPGHRDSTFILAKVTVSPSIASAGIDSVTCYWGLNQNNWQANPMKRQANGFYRTQQPIAVSEGTKVNFKLSAFYRTGSSTISKSMESSIYSFKAKRRADLCFSKQGLTIGGNEQVIIQTTVENKGETDAQNFGVEIFDGDPNSSGIRIGEKLSLNRLQAKADTTLNFSWPDEPPGAHLLFIKVDAENQVDEYNENNNIFQKEIQLVTVNKGSSGEVVSHDCNFAFTIPPAAVTLNSSFDISTKTKEEITQSYPIPQAFNLATLSDSSQRGYLLDLENEATRIIKPFSVSFLFSTKNFETLPKIYTWDSGASQWSYRTTHFDSIKNQISAQANPSDFLFGLFHVEDAVPPKISLKIENQIFAEGDYISSEPTISAVIEDEAGIDMKSQPPLVTLNNQPIDPSHLSISSSPNSKNVVMMSYSPSLSSGMHVFKMKAADLAGNWNEAFLNLKVSGEFVLQSLANHPNPFVDETILAYSLTNEAQHVKIKIYTASGRLIRTFDFINEVGYIEHIWDGCDESGDEVANGIYYMRFVAVNGKKKIERVEKVAKLK